MNCPATTNFLVVALNSLVIHPGKFSDVVEQLHLLACIPSPIVVVGRHENLQSEVLHIRSTCRFIGHSFVGRKDCFHLQADVRIWLI